MIDRLMRRHWRRLILVWVCAILAATVETLLFYRKYLLHLPLFFVGGFVMGYLYILFMLHFQRWNPFCGTWFFSVVLFVRELFFLLGTLAAVAVPIAAPFCRASAESLAAIGPAGVGMALGAFAVREYFPRFGLNMEDGEPRKAPVEEE